MSTVRYDRPHCEAWIAWEPRADGFSQVPVVCGQVVGITRWQDVAGTWHIACPRHVAERIHRYPEPEDPIEAAKWRRERLEVPS